MTRSLFITRKASNLWIVWITWLVVPEFVSSQFSSFFSGGGGGGGSAYNTPQSPCPQTFQYQSNGFEVQGVGQILPGQYEIGSDIFMLAHLVVGTQLPSVSAK